MTMRTVATDGRWSYCSTYMAESAATGGFQSTKGHYCCVMKLFLLLILVSLASRVGAFCLVPIYHHQRSTVLHPSTIRPTTCAARGLSKKSGLIKVVYQHPRLALILEAAHYTYFGSGELPHRAAAAAAAVGLAVSALTGWKMDQTFPDSGILVTLLLSGFLSNKGLVPATSPLYDLCWTLFLPASLALLLLSMKNNKSNKPRRTTTTTDDDGDSSISAVKDSVQGGALDDDEYSIAASVQRVFIPFVIASFGSVLGCLFSFVLCQYVARRPLPFHHHHHDAILLLLFLPIPEARIALSCLTASFVGGSVNFFATANQIAAAVSSSSSSSSSASMTIVSSMAAADIIVMLIYFALLGAALQSKTMKRWFEHDNSQVTRSKVVINDTNLDDSTTAPTRASSTLQQPKEQSPFMNIISVISSATLAATLAFVIVHIASRVEQLLADFVPGLACAVIVAIVPLLKCCLKQWLLPSQLSPLQSSSVPMATTKAQRTWNNVQDIAEPLSQISFFLLFASIGVSANLAGAVRSGPACLFLSLVAMLVHLVVTIGLSLLVRWQGLFWFLRPPRLLPTWIRNKTKRIMSSTRSTTTSTTARRTTVSSIRLEDVLIASNAAIGGPATAAAFCSRIRGPSQEGLTYAAVVWGVFGYAVGTTMGIFFYRFLGYVFQMT